jgi:hypothetical protein
MDEQPTTNQGRQAAEETEGERLPDLEMTDDEGQLVKGGIPKRPTDGGDT